MDAPTGPTSSRKKDHVDLTINKDVAFRRKTAGFESWEFVHNALPELDFSEITTETVFAGRTLAFPFMISCMTGGYPDAERINRELAEVCQECRIAMGVGSQRQAIEHTAYHRSFSIVRSSAPDIPIIGNIGAAEVARMTDAGVVRRLAELIGADAFAVHLNPLQEFLQPEGSTSFKGVLQGIEMLVRSLGIPVIVKEIGAGISQQVARRLMDAGVTMIDVAGAGGTSWAGVELLRSASHQVGRNDAPEENPFWDWGIPTTDALVEIAPLKSANPNLVIIASGGIASGMDCAKAVALGADLAASARPMLKRLESGGQEGLRTMISEWVRTFKGAMFLTGARDIAALQKVPIHHIRR
ncbi:MAG: type 2 isopentenyl-diphosphate Delta-isomerase [Acidobacteriota bacterium]